MSRWFEPSYLIGVGAIACIAVGMTAIVTHTSAADRAGHDVCVTGIGSGKFNSARLTAVDVSGLADQARTMVGSTRWHTAGLDLQHFLALYPLATAKPFDPNSPFIAQAGAAARTLVHDCKAVR